MKYFLLLLLSFFYSCQVKKFAEYDESALDAISTDKVSKFDQLLIKISSDGQFYKPKGLVVTNTSNEAFHQYTEDLKGIYLFRKILSKKEGGFTCAFLLKNNSNSPLSIKWSLLSLSNFMGGYKTFTKTLQPNQQTSWKTQLNINPWAEISKIK